MKGRAGPGALLPELEQGQMKTPRKKGLGLMGPMALINGRRGGT